MKTALVCSPVQITCERLSAALARARYAVECVSGLDEISANLKQKKRDVLIVETKKDSFAEIMKLSFHLNPAMIVHFFIDQHVFCFYPANRQPSEIIQSIKYAGINISNRLLLHTNTCADDNIEIIN